MKLHPYHIELLSAKIGEDVTTPAGATRLSFEIGSAVGVRLGVNTILLFNVLSGHV